MAGVAGYSFPDPEVWPMPSNMSSTMKKKTADQLWTPLTLRSILKKTPDYLHQLADLFPEGHEITRTCLDGALGVQSECAYLRPVPTCTVATVFDGCWLTAVVHAPPPPFFVLGALVSAPGNELADKEQLRRLKTVSPMFKTAYTAWGEALEEIASAATWGSHGSGDDIDYNDADANDQSSPAGDGEKPPPRKREGSGDSSPAKRTRSGQSAVTETKP